VRVGGWNALRLRERPLPPGEMTSGSKMGVEGVAGAGDAGSLSCTKADVELKGCGCRRSFSFWCSFVSLSFVGGGNEETCRYTRLASVAVVSLTIVGRTADVFLNVLIRFASCKMTYRAQEKSPLVKGA
jgi:hypothetical protein